SPRFFVMPVATRLPCGSNSTSLTMSSTFPGPERRRVQSSVPSPAYFCVTQSMPVPYDEPLTYALPVPSTTTRPNASEPLPGPLYRRAHCCTPLASNFTTSASFSVLRNPTL